MKQARKEDTIQQVLELDNNLASVFLSHGMFCIGCPSARSETVEEACEVHGIDVNELLLDINKYLAEH